ncbi:O-antigen ligase family protein [Pelagibacterium sp. 26DY04]|uniref:O-antigen ligase family protein n=1 Tax=Pelagibacterium sp. 26DY04 TaxID=2967130 RepID=UPI0028153326|nr:O-antigen ligase family protein [Pelagibacterium sp. 26DY04]WMT88563.1 O-antigen ligase family protein [Pelagibacterium sp. 26DY04]
MTAALPGQIGLDRRPLGQAWAGETARKALGLIVALWIFSGGFVIFEPSPYEVMFIIAFAVALMGGLKLHRDTLPLLFIVLAFTPFALISTFFMRYQPVLDGLIFNLVTIFLLITSYFAANFVAQSPFAHMRLIAKAYIAIALITSVVGVLAYVGVLPGEDVFLRFGRAKAFFNDPNVYGPFLILPAAIVLQRTLLGTGRTALWAGLAYLVIFVGVFVSFSRGAWGHLAASSLLVFAMVFFLEATAREKVRLLLVAIGGVMILAAAMAILLSIPVVAELFTHRFTLTQSYDTGELGRFGRIWYTLDLALNNPWGIGPLEYGYLRISEQPHNTYANVLLTYGWGGGLAYYVLVGWTLLVGGKTLLRPSPHRTLLIPVFATFVPMIMLSGIIDTDHWRHWFLVTGLVWGICAAYGAPSSTRRLLP